MTIHTPQVRIHAYLVQGIVVLPPAHPFPPLRIPVEYGVAEDTPEQARGEYVDRALAAARGGIREARRQGLNRPMPTAQNVLVHHTKRMVEWEREAAILVAVALAGASAR